MQLILASAEQLPLERASFDTAVVTWSLCTIPDPRSALEETRRVLRPGSTLHFVEHGASPDPRIHRWQERLMPLWRRCAGGCHLDRRPGEPLLTSGFELRELRAGYAPGLKVLAHMYEGVASVAG